MKFKIGDEVIVEAEGWKKAGTVTGYNYIGDNKNYYCVKCAGTTDIYAETEIKSVGEYLSDYRSQHGDQTAKADAGKPRLTLVPRKIIWAIAEIREYGCKKYPNGGTDNWKKVEIERYRDAMYRHMMRYLDDPHGVDDESGKPHLWHHATNVAFLCELEDFNGDGIQ